MVMIVAVIALEMSGDGETDRSGSGIWWQCMGWCMVVVHEAAHVVVHGGSGGGNESW